jgi:cupin fold WbuC family metalloprotein
VGEVFRNSEAIVTVGREWVSRLRAAAAASPRGTARLCLHRSDSDPVQEMVIALTDASVFPPHRHLQKSESFHILDGRLAVLIFDTNGALMERIELASDDVDGGVRMYRLSEPFWHTVYPRSPYVVFHETTTGPYEPERDGTEVAPWAPQDEDALRRFVAEHADVTGAVRRRESSSG